ncbi:thiamine-monophosphate kinase [Sphingopyxis sp. H038]|uniref:thiamine-phosphate kinase n=1 Tax=unclassified Sphingopyxis TaxID=2614943 RepID=UPI000731D26B|nr:MULTISPECIES: thiamine-phosphate kinase [unclassified Sphingopyxis]KTD99622.1 thiamine-monophosphate kinase [Sphingopyxis sp. H012]KTE01931.1 thiamine-monophosphate kinase [Sphingopyxis sp. H093]KTE12327.1 thiamine-monophosphate kinase [Sphingopyxis sp. H053]KTE17548.1 thiamine-monophosphate kinase [Sphingopyxis sp. H080]KTE31534.1 thiamine-monophosphate kinase [Sphingopyxis sp. H038]
MSEADFIARLRAIATDPAARGLADDAAVLGDLVLTHDMIVEGVHFLPDDRPQDVAWKLVAVNLSDLAAKGAAPLGVLVGYSLTGDELWDAAFVRGLGEVLRRYEVPLLGGDTVGIPGGAPRTFGLTAIGKAPATGAPARSGVRPGDQIWITGTIGNAGLGLAMRLGQVDPNETCLAAYCRPEPQLAFGQAVAPHVHAMMDVSDGLLIDAQRMAGASGCELGIMLESVPLSAALLAVRPDILDTRLAAASAGDDYQLLFTADPSAAATIRETAAGLNVTVTLLGHAGVGEGITLTHRAQRIALPDRLGFMH